ncbi:hypothetical protein PENTCL1PPCAC_14190, partial [Pristionchus entomophagus]
MSYSDLHGTRIARFPTNGGARQWSVSARRLPPYWRHIYAAVQYLFGKHVLILGFLDVRSVTSVVFLFILLVINWPLYTTILYIRWQILTEIEKKSTNLSQKSKRLQRKFVSMLTAQAAVPIVQFYSVVTFLLEFLNILHDPVLEYSSLLVGETTAFLSPIVVLYSIDHYKK